jgi:hypothetical protein
MKVLAVFAMCLLTPMMLMLISLEDTTGIIITSFMFIACGYIIRYVPN